jgi:hypothetical protein
MEMVSASALPRAGEAHLMMVKSNGGSVMTIPEKSSYEKILDVSTGHYFYRDSASGKPGG